MTPAKRLIMMGFNLGKMQPISNLPVGALVKDITTKYYGSPIIWVIADKNHAGYPANSVTLLSKYVLALKCADAKEPSNDNSDRRDGGNNRYLYSNIRQWLNSAAAAGVWYTAQHSADEPPNNANVWNGYNDYDAEAGFQNDFSANFRNALLSTSLTVVKPSVDGAGTETAVDKVFLLSTTEVGLADEGYAEGSATEVGLAAEGYAEGSTTEVGLADEGYAEGSKLALFSDNTSRQAYPTDLCISNSEFTNAELNTGSPWDWWLRTPNASSAYYMRRVSVNGRLASSSAAYGNRGVRPACNLPSSILVSDTPDEDGAYIIQWGGKVNLLGDDGVLDSLTGWDIAGTVELDSNIKYVGTKSAKFTPAGALCRMQKDYYNTLAEKYYIAIANVYIQSYSEGIIRLQITDASSLSGVIRTDANTALLNQWQPLLVRFRKTNFRYWIGSTSAPTTAVYYVDGLSVYEVSENEYNSFTDDQLISKYNY